MVGCFPVTVGVVHRLPECSKLLCRIQWLSSRWVRLLPHPPVAPPGTTTPGCISSSAPLHSHPEKNREKTGMRKHTVRSSVCISRNDTLGKTETGLQTAVPKNSDCDFPKQTMEINCNPVKSKNGTGTSKALEFWEPRLIYAKEINMNV